MWVQRLQWRGGGHTAGGRKIVHVCELCWMGMRRVHSEFLRHWPLLARQASACISSLSCRAYLQGSCPPMQDRLGRSATAAAAVQTNAGAAHLRWCRESDRVRAGQRQEAMVRHRHSGLAAVAAAAGAPAAAAMQGATAAAGTVLGVVAGTIAGRAGLLATHMQRRWTQGGYSWVGWPLCCAPVWWGILKGASRAK